MVNKIYVFEESEVIIRRYAVYANTLEEAETKYEGGDLNLLNVLADFSSRRQNRNVFSTIEEAEAAKPVGYPYAY